MIKRIFLASLFLLTLLFSQAQAIDEIINIKEVERIEKVLAADDMQGRKPATPGGLKAASFIEDEFKKAGLQFLPGLNSFMQTFTIEKAKLVSAEGSINGKPLSADNIICMTTQPLVTISETSGYKIVVADTSNIVTQAKRIMKDETNCIVLVNHFQAGNFNKLKYLRRDAFGMKYSIIFISTDESSATNYNFNIKHDVTTSELKNVVGILPGKTKKEEFVVFSGHYDHLGIGKPNADMDSIYNGANDDAAGTTAVIMLANHFSKMKNNERTLIFVAFTSEESGGYGSRYFSQHIDATRTVAMFNIEMIGTESKWGKNSTYITGYEKSDFGKILQANLAGTDFHFEPDPYPNQKLFYRSDNATLAALGVPAHTISTSKMDSEKYYHTVDDEIETLDMNNMAAIIKAIAISSKTIVNGKETPTRIEKVNGQ
ncbi:MAG: M28 family peptidase [Ferruginibacter sp.]